MIAVHRKIAGDSGLRPAVAPRRIIKSYNSFAVTTPLLFFCDATVVACLEVGKNKVGLLRLTCSGHTSCARSRLISYLAGSDLT